ncbi:hypothetical protein [Psychromicrobium sp. YIM B11713]|uniref:hypothetical protein n=1 Tax=Psychromicrobium sp. YIM B11713 TaxID=3145233 RepID=UPI00374F39C9
MSTAADDRRELLQAILGLMDNLPLSRVKRLLDKRITTYSTTFPAKEVYDLLDSVDHVEPELLDRYVE